MATDSGAGADVAGAEVAAAADEGRRSTAATVARSAGRRPPALQVSYETRANARAPSAQKVSDDA